ncbi:hypothetical protein [Thalassospira mesophila]|uniref:Uncharacterized protein n=1 Tax=Thalassospira mesophila TaxID=1293891 RepID=A0A1Y2L3B8_9PROT|nr:hypothetical protein [Thalassospira mesophila]OSQ39667.1 hypothetical protein TMES_06740 [Thalassospira mesophila]
MADTSTPVPSVSGANAVGTGSTGAANAGVGTVAQNAPEALAKLPVDSLIQAAIQSRNGAETTLQTALGNVNVRLPAQLPGSLNDLVWVRIMPQTGTEGTGGTNGLRLQVLPQTLLAGGGTASTAGSAPAPILPGQSFTGITTTSLALPGGATLPAGSQMQMVFVAPGAASPAKAAGLFAPSQLAGQAATTVSVGQGAAQPAGVVGTIGAAGTAGASGTPASSTLSATAAGNAAITNSAIAAGQTGTANKAGIVSGAGIQAGGAGRAALSAPVILTGTVLPANSPEARLLPDGFTALRTNAGVIGVKLPVPAPVGATLSFAIDANSAAAARIPQPVMTEGELMARGQAASLTHNWDSLQRAISTLAQFDPQAAQAILNQIPSAGPRLTNTMMFFFSAMTGSAGSAKSWLGERSIGSLDGRDSKDAGLGKKLEGDFNILRSMASEQRPDGWRVMSMPFQMGERIEQMQLAWRHGHSDEDDSPAGKTGDPGTRFLLDLSFTALGHTQLDGLVRKDSQKFDLIVRTENTLDGPQRDDIRAIFNEALTIAKLGGALNFQNGSRFIEVSPTPEPQGPQKRGLEA